jgi:hypothetical protein
MVVQSYVLGLQQLGLTYPLKKMVQGLNPKWNVERCSCLNLLFT